MILKREFDIIKKLYIPPHIEFEDLEVDEGEMLMAGSDTSGGGSHEGLDPDDPSKPEPGEDEFEGQSIDLDFVMNS